jgi:hypothetical protein
LPVSAGEPNACPGEKYGLKIAGVENRERELCGIAVEELERRDSLSPARTLVPTEFHMLGLMVPHEGSTLVLFSLSSTFARTITREPDRNRRPGSPGCLAPSGAI